MMEAGDGQVCPLHELASELRVLVSPTYAPDLPVISLAWHCQVGPHRWWWAEYPEDQDLRR